MTGNEKDSGLLLGLDISTTGAKALLVDSGGNVVSSATTPLTLSTPRPLWSLRAAGRPCGPPCWAARSGSGNRVRLP